MSLPEVCTSFVNQKNELSLSKVVAIILPTRYCHPQELYNTREISITCRHLMTHKFIIKEKCYQLFYYFLYVLPGPKLLKIYMEAIRCVRLGCK